MSPASPSPANRAGSLASRLVAGLVATGLFAALAWADVHRLGGTRPMGWLLPLVLIVASGAGREAVRLAGNAGIPLSPWLVPLGSGLIAAAPAILGLGPGGTDDPMATIGRAAIGCMMVVIVAFASGVARYAAGGRELALVAGSIAAAVSIGLPFAFMVGLRLLPDDASAEQRAALLRLVSLIAVVKAGDIAAYSVGSLLGRHRMAPALSPGKTWEGAAASIATSVAVAWLVLERLGAGLAARPFGGWLLFGVLVGAAGILGDLSESLAKRDLSAKDSGRMLGGMGGFLDLIDSLLMAAPVAWLLWAAG